MCGIAVQSLSVSLVVNAGSDLNQEFWHLRHFGWSTTTRDFCPCATLMRSNAEMTRRADFIDALLKLKLFSLIR
jgi:hypothetical protein